MKNLIVNTESLLTALQTANKAANKNAALPILETFLIDVKATGAGAVLTVSATDLENSIIVSFPCEAKESFSFILPVSEIKMIEKMESENLVFTASAIPVKNKKGEETGNEYFVNFTGGEDKAKVQSDNPADFPKIPAFTDGKQLLAWVNGDFQSELKTLLNYISKDDLRPGICGVFFETLADGYNLTATDCHILKHLTLKGETLYNGELSEKNKITAILPGKFLKLVSSFSKVNETLLAIQDRNFFAKFSLPGGFDVSIVTRSIDANFPDYAAVIPHKNPITVKAEIKPILKLISKAALYANKTTFQGIFSINGDIKVSATDLDFNKEYTGRMNHNQHTGGDIEIGFNLKFVEKALKDAKGETFTLELSTPTRAGVLREANGLTLLMPVMINS